jgi:uncharacterized protein YbjT (DUF2867 family)
MNKALLIGSNGLIGSSCLKELLTDNYYTSIEIWVRNSSGIEHPKLIETIVNFDELKIMKPTDAQQVFCCLGTTIKKAKTKEAFRMVDYDYVVDLAKLSEKSGVEKFQVISSIGANAKTNNFYLKTKGEMEEAVKRCKIPSIIILRPSILFGKRKEFRFGEAIGKFMMRLLTYFFWGKMKKYRGIEASAVAKAMICLAKGEKYGFFIVESDELQVLNKRI